jgi:hypothetical protein
METEVGKLILRFELEEDDRPIPNEKYQMKENVVTTILPDDFDPDTIHPDLLGLCCIMMVEPFIGRTIELPKPASNQFFEGHARVTSRYKISNVDEKLLPWKPKPNANPGLAFSGGVDSTAALSVLPHSTVPVFLDRPLRGKSLYNKDAVEQSCIEVKRLGYNIHTVQCDLEYVRSPVGFPVDVANSVPAILLADYLNIDCIAFGTIMESSYGIGHKSYRDYPNGNHYRHWGGMFAAAGIPFNLPVAGISEIGTSLIVRKSPIGFIAQSCMRGTWKHPCMNCWKCFRKLILDSAINSEIIDLESLNDLFRNKEALRFVSAIPIKHENVLTWATNRLDIDYELFELLKVRVEGYEKSYNWMDKWYSKSIELVPEKYQSYVEGKISEYLETMDETEEFQVTNWSMQEIIEAEQTKKNSDNLVEAMKEHIKPHQQSTLPSD